MHACLQDSLNRILLPYDVRLTCISRKIQPIRLEESKFISSVIRGDFG